MFSKLFPKEFNFFDSFDKEMESVARAAKLFKKIVVKGRIEDKLREEMREIEHEGDKMAYAVIDNLNKTFITPFDREDIHTLAKKLDDVNDMINTIVSRMKIYKIKKADKYLIRFADMIEESVGELGYCINGLRSIKNSTRVLKSCMHISRLESDGDKLRDEALTNLFDKRKKDIIEVIKWKEIYQDAETVLDICKVVGHTVESILVKQA